ncbi:hypothetical protein B0H21DRAFT_194113 [Amylocystis lapponica]|nr:hypothetical protein B0H21DRAFT_194113 [Amylocystis lapponica]
MSSAFQNALYVGINVGSILYGIELMLYFQTIHELYKNRRLRRGSDKFFTFFSTAMLLLITVSAASQAISGQEAWIINADFPGGAEAYQAVNMSAWYQTVSSVTTIVLDMLTDGLLVYRCYVVWNSHRVIILPCILWFVVLGLGIAEMWAGTVPQTDFWLGLSQDIGIAYFTTTIGLNVFLTCLICGRILWFARRLHTKFGSSDAPAYIGVVSIIVESALPYTLSGIVFLVLYGLGSELSPFFLICYGMFTCISPQMLILRVVKGEAWTRSQTEETVSAIAFTPSNRRASMPVIFHREDLEGVRRGTPNTNRATDNISLNNLGKV